MEIKLEAVWTEAKEPKTKAQLSINGQNFIVDVKPKSIACLILETMLGENFCSQPIYSEWVGGLFNLRTKTGE